VIITHKNLEHYLEKLANDPGLQCGGVRTGHEWYDSNCILEFPLGELCKDELTTLALVGQEQLEPVAITGKEGFNAQGLEGKVCVNKPLLNAILNMRDILPPYRGRIIWKIKTKA